MAQVRPAEAATLGAEPARAGADANLYDPELVDAIMTDGHALSWLEGR